MSNRVPAEVFPPGEFIRDELEARSWTQADLAEILGRPLKAVSEILMGKRAVTPETAKGLGEAFGVDPQFWMNLESTYRLSLVKDQTGDVARRARLFGAVPVKDMIRRHWINDAEDVAGLESEVLRFFAVDSVDAIASMSVAVSPRKSTNYDETTPPQFAWYSRARQIAPTLQVSPYRKETFDQLIAELVRLTASELEVRRVPRVLAEFGVRFMVIEHLPRTRIDGAAFWLNQDSPVVAISIRLDRIDSFWFTLFHELGHIFHGHSQSVDNDLAGDGPSSAGELPDSERMADEFASERLVPVREIDSLIARIRPLYSRSRITQFANRIRVHPGIIIGQLQRQGEIKCSQGREMLVKIRDSVTQTATTDGWGHFPSQF
ncbi:MAG: HigA family addiction module antitoxin [Isosphaeraceae bacterium]